MKQRVTKTKMDSNNTQNKQTNIWLIIVAILITISCITNIILSISIMRMHAYTMQFIQDTFYYGVDEANQEYANETEQSSMMPSDNIPLQPAEE